MPQISSNYYYYYYYYQTRLETIAVEVGGVERVCDHAGRVALAAAARHAARRTIRVTLCSQQTTEHKTVPKPLKFLRNLCPDII